MTIEKATRIHLAISLGLFGISSASIGLLISYAFFLEGSIAVKLTNIAIGLFFEAVSARWTWRTITKA